MATSKRRCWLYRLRSREDRKMVCSNDRFWGWRPAAFFKDWAALSASRYVGDKETLCLYWPLGTVVITGPKALDFYAGFCAHRASCLKADGKDIKVLNLILSGNSDGASETDPSKGPKPEK